MKKPTIKEFLFKYKEWFIFTDCSFMNHYIFSNYFVLKIVLWWKLDFIIKKWESIRKQLWEFKKAWIIEEIKRETKWNSEEITYKLIRNDKKRIYG